jgi:hypothetical protein
MRRMTRMTRHMPRVTRGTMGGQPAPTPAFGISRTHAIIIAVVAGVLAVVMFVWVAVRRHHHEHDHDHEHEHEHEHEHDGFRPEPIEWVEKQTLLKALSGRYSFAIVQKAPRRDPKGRHVMAVSRLSLFSSWPGAPIVYNAWDVRLSPQEGDADAAAASLTTGTGDGTMTRHTNWTDGALFDNYVRVRVAGGIGFSRAVIVPAKPLHNAVARLEYFDERGAGRVLAVALPGKTAEAGVAIQVRLRHTQSQSSQGSFLALQVVDDAQVTPRPNR